MCVRVCVSAMRVRVEGLGGAVDMQENLKEYQELQMLATWALLELHDT